jgi:hypothetical protein
VPPAPIQPRLLMMTLTPQPPICRHIHAQPINVNKPVPAVTLPARYDAINSTLMPKVAAYIRELGIVCSGAATVVAGQWMGSAANRR